MADLEFKHNVSQIPRGDEVPAPYKRAVSAQTSNIPDFQGTVNQYAQNTNWMSSLGSRVAIQSSKAIAAKLGTDLGKNPQGELGPSFTDFDKDLEESYSTQAQQTLSLQAQKLITNSNLELAAAPRIDHGMIAKTNAQVSQGLNKILSLAPDSVKGKLEYQFGSTMIEQNARLTERLIREQKEDRINTFNSAIKLNNENAYSLSVNGIGLDKDGNSKPALEYVKATEKATKSAIANRDISPVDASKINDSNWISYLSGKYERLANEAAAKHNLPEFMDSLTKNPKDIPTKYHDAVYQNVFKAIQDQQRLRNEKEQYLSQEMRTRIMADPGSITDAEFNAYAAQVSPLLAQKEKFNLIQAVMKKQNSDNSMATLSQHWDNPTVVANSSPELINKTFNKKVEDAVEQSGKITIPMRPQAPMSRDDAEVMVASNAGGQIPVFTKSLINKLKSSNPMNVESGIQQIHQLLQSKNGQALSGLSDQDWSMFTAAQANRDSPDPIKANQDAHNRIYNQDPTIEKLNKENFAHILSKQNSAGISNDQFALKTVGLSKGDFLNPTLASAYGANILTKLQNFYAISGDFEQAKQSTQTWVDQNYGNTFINGGKHTTLHPIEQVVGFQGRDGVPYIQQNIVDQFNQKMIPIKQLYDSGKGSEYWETVPINIPKKTNTSLFSELSNAPNDTKSTPELQGITHPKLDLKFESSLAKNMRANAVSSEFHEATTTPSQQHGMVLHTYDPIKIKRHMRTANGEKTDVFNVVLIGNMFGDYDIGIESKSGMRNLFAEAPHLGIISITPDKKAIMDHYNKDHNI